MTTNAQWVAQAINRKTGNILSLYLYSVDLADVKKAKLRARAKAAAKWKALGLAVKGVTIRCVG